MACSSWSRQSPKFPRNRTYHLAFCCVCVFAQQEWQPAWGLRLILEALISFFPTTANGALGGLDLPVEARRCVYKRVMLAVWCAFARRVGEERPSCRCWWSPSSMISGMLSAFAALLLHAAGQPQALALITMSTKDLGASHFAYRASKASLLPLVPMITSSACIHRTSTLQEASETVAFILLPQVRQCSSNTARAALKRRRSSSSSSCP